MTPKVHQPFTALVAGLKGSEFAQGLIDRGHRPSRVVSYGVKGERAQSFERIAEICSQYSIPLDISKNPAFDERELAFVVGWQSLIRDERPELIVFHDSLLPRYRGFAPTVAALINGDDKIGVTALRPTERIDAGPIILQKPIAIEYPIKIEKALTLQAAAMAEIAADILQRAADGGATDAAPQDEAKATYSIWRDDDDYRIDWSQSSDRIKRTIDALGDPYSGARADFEGAPVVITDAAVIPDIAFEIRHVGKIWRLDEGRPVVVCGKGLLRLDKVVGADSAPVEFARIRARFS